MFFDAVLGLRAYIAASPLAWLFATLAVYLFARWVYRRSGEHALANPVLVAVVLLSAVLWLTGVDYGSYFEGAQFIHFLLGPVTVLLAVPLYRSLPLLRSAALPVAVALLAGSLLAALPAILVAHWLGASDTVMRSLAAKSVTTPIAIGVTESLGGLPAFTAVVVVFTGVLGSVMGDRVFRLARVRQSAARGFALGLTAHGMGIGRAVQIDTTAAAFAGIGMSLNGLLTALWAPSLVPLVLAALA